jgi:homocitrate synthase
MAGHRLTGRHAIASRATALGLTLTDDKLRTLTSEVKRRADAGPLSNDELDDLLRGESPTLTLPRDGIGNLEASNGHTD